MRLDNKKFILLLAEKQLTYTEVTNLTGLSYKTVFNARKGSCSHKTIGKLAKALNVPVTDLIED